MSEKEMTLKELLSKPSLLAYLYDPEGYAKALERWKRAIGWRKMFRGEGGGARD